MTILVFNEEFKNFTQKLLFHNTALKLRTILPFYYFSVDILVFRNFHEILEFLPAIFIISFYSRIIFFFFFSYVGEFFSGNNFFSSVEILPENSVVFDVDPHIEIIFDRHHQTHQS